ncbi:hypothetical protein B0J17DRAFT_708339 [Rhizoctonia solani]|nr:hypothetical protein B0J17DRAFT_708339 [Rhizoctonia solani]
MSLLLPGGDIMDLLEWGLTQTELAKRLTMVSLTLLFYYWVSNLHLEVAYIWGAPWTYGRFLYHLNRICPLMLLLISLPGISFFSHRCPSSLNPPPVWDKCCCFIRPLTKRCRQVVYLYTYGCSIATDIITGVLVLRCWALYSSRRVLWTLSAGLVCTTTCTIVIASQIMKKTIFIPALLPEILSGCRMLPPTLMWIAFIPTTIYESTLFILTLWRLGFMKKRYGSTVLSRRLAEQGVLYFGVRVTLIIFACVGGSVRTIQIATNASGIIIAISSVMCSRMIFSLYQLNHERKDDQSTLALTSDRELGIPMSPIQAHSLQKDLDPY